ncbi:MAG: hypothetical protein HOP18_21990 [Deltaproteobacteria bacterium]|nr:hypothetical protein [Deltaproteobacteria bacterium]
MVHGIRPWLLLFLLWGMTWSGNASAAQVFKLTLTEASVYRVRYEELAAAGLRAPSVNTTALSLSAAGSPVPLWVEDGGDGQFGAGDWVEFVGQPLAGEASHANEFIAHNTYLLHVGEKDAQDTTPPLDAPSATKKEKKEQRGPASLVQPYVSRHLEEDRLLTRFRPKDETMQELWYWAKLTHLDPKPFTVPLDLSDRLATSTEPLTVRLSFRGWSHATSRTPATLADHRVEVLFNDEMVGSGEWNGQEGYQLDVQVPAKVLSPTHNVVTLRIPKRLPPPTATSQPATPATPATPLVDVVLCNWLEVTYPRDPMIAGPEPVRFVVPSEQPTRTLALGSQADARLTLYGQNGARITVPAKERLQHHVALPEAETVFYAVVNQSFKTVTSVALDQPSQLKAKTNRADYLMIVPSRLRGAIAPLAAFHQKRGLAVSVIDIEDVYDEFHHGILHPRALRDLIAHAYHQWAKPAPRFVLLVGDASWDGKNSRVEDANYSDWTYQPGETIRFSKNGSTAYTDGHLGSVRNLIPTWNYNTFEGHAASDTWFAEVDGEDFYPDVAIGRFPVTEPSEVAAIVKKTIHYMERPEVGPWRRNMLWITNDESHFQASSDTLAATLTTAGFAAHKIYPKMQDVDNARHQERLRGAFDEGQLLVHFYGHGGRYIWRTGPPDLRKNHDLFTLADLDKLSPTGRLPIVLSMTCYSAPFDHPTADSIGEKFLRLPDRGAIAVFAASWRNSPSINFSQMVVQELSKPGTIGEAIMRAKRLEKDRLLVETYNLLGDPAVPLALPQLPVTLTLENHNADSARVTAEVGAQAVPSQALIEWLDQSGEVVHHQEVKVPRSRFTTTYDGTPERFSAVRAVRAYVWNAKANIDGVGGVAVPPQAAAVGTGSVPGS